MRRYDGSVIESASSLPTLPLRLSLAEIIGLKDPAEGDWSRLRALQYRDLHGVSVVRAMAHAIAAMVVIGLFSGDVADTLLWLWGIALSMALVYALRVDAGLVDIDRRAMTRSEFFRHATSTAVVSTLWSTPLLVFAPAGSLADHYALWTLTAMLIVGSAALMASAPLNTLIFATIAGIAACVSFLVVGDIGFAVATLVFAVLIIAGGLQSARTYLAAQIAQAGVVEKDEVVSLLLREFEENEADWLWQVDTKRCIRAVSPRFAYALGMDPKQIEGQSLVRLIAGANWEQGEFEGSLHELADHLKARQSFSNLLVRVDLADGRRWWELSGTPMHDEVGKFTGFRGVGSDVTEQRESSEKIAYLARYDTLTGLPNRLMLTEALGEALRYAEQWKSRCAFLMIDLDRFKAVNDSLGHQVGDQLLAQVSDRLRSVMAKGEQCGRLGGDEFAVVIRDAAIKGRVATLAEDIIASLSAPYRVADKTLYIGASVGSAVGPRDGDTVEMLMRNADLALYRAKEDGRGVHCGYLPSLHADAEERRSLETALRHALQNNELELHYQPVVDANTEQVVSFEALMRWNSKEHGFVSPGKFIPLAEDTRLIVPIGAWALRQACAEAARWPGHVKVAVNVSGEQLSEPGFSESVVRALAHTGLPAHRLEIEVTESVFLKDGRIARQVLEEIKALGCSIALDDFGTGYSSLGYLRTLRFSTIKVDRSFVQGAAQDSPESLAIIRAVVAMAQSLDMSTTAEGVEDATEAAMVRDMGCTKIQGYYYGRPMPVAEARALVHRKARAA